MGVQAKGSKLGESGESYVWASNRFWGGRRGVVRKGGPFDGDRFEGTHPGM